MKLTSMPLNEYQMIDDTLNQKMVDALQSAYEQIELCKREFKKNLTEDFCFDFDSQEHLNAVVDFYCSIKKNECVMGQNVVITLDK